MTWGKDTTKETDLGEVAQPLHTLCATSSTSGHREDARTPRHPSASEDAVGFPMFDLFEVTSLAHTLVWASSRTRIMGRGDRLPQDSLAGARSPNLGLVNASLRWTPPAFFFFSRRLSGS